MSDLVAIARKRKGRIRTHWAGCEEEHAECLIQKMADEIEWLRGLLRDIEPILERGDDDCDFAVEMTALLKRVREALGE